MLEVVVLHARSDGDLESGLVEDREREIVRGGKRDFSQVRKQHSPLRPTTTGVAARHWRVPP